MSLGSYQLKPKDVERRLFTCEQLLQWQKRKCLLHRIVTGDEKWIDYDNPKRRKSWREKFKRTGFVADASRSGRRKTAANEGTSTQVLAAVDSSPKKGTRRLSAQMGISQSSECHVQFGG
ncbi:hypothetical protein AVEN_122514-1 [Araneus ventricosus]|uniref:Mariner Mos1 transposase n=1 Tax=Araneus ventricosus TaxID=182803 RepID=A0A4Y2KA51_ARAVE|nr:hypothetical protein AVEN_122514-1 [Araneus ventricosus]